MSSTDVGSDKSRELKLRVLSALVIGPATLAITWWGGIPFSLLIVLCAVIMADEWETIVLGETSARERLITVALVGLSVAAGAFGRRVGLSPAAVLTIVVAAMGVAAAVAMRGARIGGREGAVSWAPWGAFYAVLPSLALDALRADALGLWLILFLFAVVWSTDIAAYFTGRALGGPKLMPRVSPKKTWSGALGGLSVAILAGVGVAYLAGAPHLLPVAGVAAVMSVASQAGDLLESLLKRRFDVKDSGRIIPGHGGLLDRVDGLVAAALVAVLVSTLHGSGHGGPGLLFW